MNVARPNFVRYIFVIQSVFFSVEPTDIALIPFSIGFSNGILFGRLFIHSTKAFSERMDFFSGTRVYFLDILLFGKLK